MAKGEPNSLAMSRVTTIITGPDGRVTRVVTRRSGCGCLTALALAIVLFGPAAWFPLPLAIVAYIFLGVIAVVVGVGWVLQAGWIVKNVRRPTPAAEPPPAPAPPP